MSATQRRDREETPGGLINLFGFLKGKSREEEIRELEQDWIPLLEKNLDKARRLLESLRRGR